MDNVVADAGDDTGSPDLERRRRRRGGRREEEEEKGVVVDTAGHTQNSQRAEFNSSLRGPEGYRLRHTLTSSLPACRVAGNGLAWRRPQRTSGKSHAETPQLRVIVSEWPPLDLRESCS